MCADWLWVLTNLPLFACLFYRPTGSPSFLKWSRALPLHLYLLGRALWLLLLSGGNTFLALPCLQYLERIWSHLPQPGRFPSCPAPFRVHHLYRQPCAWGTPRYHEGSGGGDPQRVNFLILNRKSYRTHNWRNPRSTAPHPESPIPWPWTSKTYSSSGHHSCLKSGHFLPRVCTPKSLCYLGRVSKRPGSSRSQPWLC